jgi:hypothetical protein
VLLSLCTRLVEQGHSRIIFTDLTDPRIDIPTVHVYIEGMADTVADPERRRRHVRSAL